MTRIVGFTHMLVLGRDERGRQRGKIQPHEVHQLPEKAVAELKTAHGAKVCDLTRPPLYWAIQDAYGRLTPR